MSLVQAIRVKLSISGRDYATIRIPHVFAEKYGIDEKCTVEITDREDLGGILVKKWAKE